MKLDYIKVGDYFIPALVIAEEKRPIGHWGRLHKRYLEETNPIRYNQLALSCEIYKYLADLNEQAESRLETIIRQMKEAEGVTEELKARQQLLWVQSMNSIRNRAEEIIKAELIYI